MNLIRTALFVLAAVQATFAGEARWPQFRGVGAAGVAPGDIPIHFGPESNVVWKIAVPGGHSSPCIWDDRIFLTGFGDGQLQVLCIDRSTGAVLWRRALQPGAIERGAQLSNPSTGTPATDGESVFVYFGSFGLAAFDFQGVEKWRKPLPVPVTQHGAGTSPVLAGERLILNCDQDVDSFILAVDKRTGQTLWRTERSNFRRGFSTPLPYPVEAPREVIISGTLRLVAYDLRTGAETWSVTGLANEMVTSPVAGAGLIFVAGWTPGSGVSRMQSFDALLEQSDADHDGKLIRSEVPVGPAKQHFLYIDANKDGFVTRAEYDVIASVFDQSRNVALAVRPGGKGDVTKTHVVWKHTRGLPYCSSPLFYDNKMFLVKNGGIATCLDAQTGAPFYSEERLGALGDYYSSPVAASGKICVISHPGVAVILRAGGKLDVLARNPLGEPMVATPAIAEGKLYVRGKEHLFAFGEVSASPSGDPSPSDAQATSARR
jgi:outer membrane protein assembly factor BamB